MDLNFWILLIKRNRISNWLRNVDISGLILNRFSLLNVIKGKGFDLQLIS